MALSRHSSSEASIVVLREKVTWLDWLVHGRCSDFYTDLPPFVKAPAEAVWEPGPQACRAGSGYGSAARVEMSARYRVVAAAIVRTGAALDSPKAAAHTLRVGQEIVVTEQVRLGEQVRLKFDGGWTSQTARNGSVLLELVQPDKEFQVHWHHWTACGFALAAVSSE